KVRIYYNLSATPITYYAAPMEPVERFLRTGEYTFAVTFYDNHTAGSTVYFYLNVTDAEFLLIEGNTISRVITDIAGVYALEQVITTMVTPDIVYIAACLPRVPGELPEEVVYIHPYAIMTATVEEEYNGTSSALYLPYPSVAGVTTTIIEDYLNLNGNYSTEVWLNYSSNGTSYKHFANCPSYVPLNGGNYTLESSDTVSAHRLTRWRQESLFYYSYYTSTKRYEVTLTANNSMSYSDMEKVYWYVGFPENRSIELGSVRVYDLNNDLWLAPAVNYEVTASGIRMYWQYLNASTYRSFQIAFYDANASESGLAIAYVEDYDSTTYEGEPYHVCHASWTNSYAGRYVGQFVIRLNFDKAQYIEPSSVIIVDRIASRTLSDTEFAYAGTSIMINQVSADVGQIYSFDVYFLIDYEEAQDFDFFAPFFTIGGIPISAFAFLVIGLGAVSVWFFTSRTEITFTIWVIYLSIVGIVFLMEQMGYM
ncbi:MAG: hypothetical protein PHG80_11965, partial [Methanoregulaceae archaeon]|nr:hypothetical protein [Methanoregulaceae archaeon]